MAVRHTAMVGCAKAIIGVVLIGLGISILFRDVAAEIVRLSHLFGADGSDVLEAPAALNQMAAQFLQACAVDRQQIVENLLHHVLVFSCPLVLVIAGTMLPRTIYKQCRCSQESSIRLSN